jgi:glycerol-3-phosphate dehydrogenase
MSVARMTSVNREENLAKLASGKLIDLLVIGGGITGAGIALEAARTGVSTVLVEAGDFASGTSSRSSKLVHGGLRYLKQGKFALTHEALYERAALLRDAAGLVEPLRFVLPVRRGEKPGKFVYGLGLKIYDLLAGVKSRAWLEPAEVKSRLPEIGVDDLVGAWGYLDARTDDARLVLRALQEARAHGAATLNYCRVEGFLREGGGAVYGAELHDLVGGSVLPVRAKCIVSAAGVWSDGLRRLVGGNAKIRPLRGSHLLFPAEKLPAEEALAFTHPDDGRAVFIIPWEGAVIVGTTDLDHREDLGAEPSITRAEVDYLMRAVASQFPALELGADEALSSWSGVRPVISSGKAVKPSQETREHFIAEEGGLISVFGGKMTTFRAMAHEVIHHAEQYLPLLKHARRGHIFDSAPPPPRPAEWSEALYRRMLGRYGGELSALIAGAEPGELAPIPETTTPSAELRHACRREGVVHLDDLMLRRTRLGLLLAHGGEAALGAVEPIARQELRWDERRWSEEADRYRAIIRRSYSIPEAAR